MCVCEREMEGGKRSIKRGVGSEKDLREDACERDKEREGSKQRKYVREKESE